MFQEFQPLKLSRSVISSFRRSEKTETKSYRKSSTVTSMKWDDSRTWKQLSSYPSMWEFMGCAHSPSFGSSLFVLLKDGYQKLFSTAFHHPLPSYMDEWYDMYIYIQYVIIIIHDISIYFTNPSSYGMFCQDSPIQILSCIQGAPRIQL